MFTFYRTGAEGYFSDYVDMFSILKQAGYQTTWISNQGRSGTNDGDMDQLYASLCDIKKVTSIRPFSLYSPYDEQVLPLLKQSLLQTGQKKFILVHLLGTHFDYGDRYPEAFHRFTEKDETQVQDTSLKENVAAYDNAVYYGDFICNEIINQLENRNAIVIYISDHGDDVCDERENFCGHVTYGNFRMLEVPMMVWMSPACKENHPDLVRELAASTDKPFMSDDMIHVILDILQIKTPDYDPEKSLINKNYDDTRTRIYRGMIYTHGPTPGQ